VKQHSNTNLENPILIKKDRYNSDAKSKRTQHKIQLDPLTSIKKDSNLQRPTTVGNTINERKT